MIVQVDIRYNQTIDVDVDITKIIAEINDLPQVERWNLIGQLLNEVKLNIKDLTVEQKLLVKTYLQNRLELFK